MAAGDRACKREQWLLLAELSGFLEGGGFLPRPRAFCCPDIQLAWGCGHTQGQMQSPCPRNGEAEPATHFWVFPQPRHMPLCLVLTLC